MHRVASEVALLQNQGGSLSKLATAKSATTHATDGKSSAAKAHMKALRIRHVKTVDASLDNTCLFTTKAVIPHIMLCPVQFCFEISCWTQLKHNLTSSYDTFLRAFSFTFCLTEWGGMGDGNEQEWHLAKG